MERQLGKPQSPCSRQCTSLPNFARRRAAADRAAIKSSIIILEILYEDAIHPVTILSTPPSAGIGVLLLLMACHIDLSVMAILAVILLIGIVKKNGIGGGNAPRRWEGADPPDGQVQSPGVICAKLRQIQQRPSSLRRRVLLRGMLLPIAPKHGCIWPQANNGERND